MVLDVDVDGYVFRLVHLYLLFFLKYYIRLKNTSMPFIKGFLVTENLDISKQKMFNIKN